MFKGKGGTVGTNCSEIVAQTVLLFGWAILPLIYCGFGRFLWGKQTDPQQTGGVYKPVCGRFVNRPLFWADDCC